MKRNNVLLNSFKSNKKMAKGGLTQPFDSKTLGAIQSAGTIADGITDALDPVDEFGTRTGVGAAGSGAIKGAMAGAALGPIGMAGGAIIGGLTSFLGNKKAQEAKQQTLTEQSTQSAKRRDNRVAERVANDPSLVYGKQTMKMGGTIAGKPAKKFSLRAGMKVGAGTVDLMPDIAISPNKIARFETGGEIDPKDPKGKKKNTSITTKRGNVVSDEDLIKTEKATQIKWDSKEKYGEWLDTFASPLPTVSNSTVTYPFGKRGETMTQDEWDYSRKKRGYADVYSDKVQGTDNFVPGDSFANEIRNDIKEFRNLRPDKKFQDGGKLTKKGIKTFDEFTKYYDKDPNDKLYNIKQAYNIYKSNPSKFDSPSDGFARKESDGWHFSTIDPSTNTFLKHKNHPTVKKELDWYNSAEGASFKKNNDLDTSGNFYKYIPKVKKMATGGLIPTSSRTASVVGPKHSEGGVKLKDMNVEVEGGESIGQDFVFSEQLGIADIHKQIGKSMGKNEKRPLTPLNMKTQQALVRKEGFLKIYQEQKKKDMGLPNEIDNTTKGIKKAQRTGDVTIMANGGKLPKYAIGGPYKKKLNLSLGESEAAVEGVTENTSIKDILNTAAPFASNIANAFRRLPKPPKPTMDEELGAPALINLDASRSEAVRARRGADKSVEQSNTSSNAVSATKAANMVQQTRSINEINQAEENANSQIKNQAMGVNAQIRKGNNLKTDFYNQQKVERQLKQQSIDSENIADVGNKLQAIQRDKKMAALDDDKMLLTIAQDNTGATIRAGDAILKRRLSPDGYKQMKELGIKLEKAAAEDREALMAQARVIMDQAKPVTNTILADSDAQKDQDKSELNSAKVRKLLDGFKSKK